MTAAPTFSSRAAATIAGATDRQVDYWCRKGVLGPDHAAPVGSGGRRRFTVEDVRCLVAVVAVSDALTTMTGRRFTAGSTRMFAEVVERVRAGDTVLTWHPTVNAAFTVVVPAASDLKAAA